MFNGGITLSDAEANGQLRIRGDHMPPLLSLEASVLDRGVPEHIPRGSGL